jgi:YD repeat-containing protein
MNESNVARTRRKPVGRRVCMGVLALAGFAAHAGSVSYSYDALGRLASTVYTDGTSTTTITYSYDAAGNRTSVGTTSP